MSLKNQVALLADLGFLPEPEPEPDLTSFDGGVRETPPLPSDPYEDHNQFVSAVALALKWRQT